MKFPIYFDNASTTKIDKRVIKRINFVLNSDKFYGNSSAIVHKHNIMINKLIDISRKHVADLINSEVHEIYFTSSTTESINLAIKGIAYSNIRPYGNVILTTKIEHKSVLNVCEDLKRNNIKTKFIKLNKIDNKIDLYDLENCIKKYNVFMVSITHINSEIGLIEDIEKISRICQKYSIILHIDAAQSIGKFNIDVKKLDVDLVSFSCHKIYGPKGIGVLFVKSNKERFKLVPIINGGLHEDGLRAGTLPNHLIVAIGEVCRISKIEMEKNYRKVEKISNYFCAKFRLIDDIVLYDNDSFSPYIKCFSFKSLNANALLYLIRNYISCNIGASCNWFNNSISNVIFEISKSVFKSKNSIRISFSKYNSIKQIDILYNIIKKNIIKLRKYAEK